jgi:hypothetical protein
MKKLYKFTHSAGRGAYIEGVFVEEDSDIEKYIGTKVCFGEICGKHSEVVIKLKEDQFKVISDDPHVINIIEEHIGSIGHNPLNYIRDQDENNW